MLPQWTRRDKRVAGLAGEFELGSRSECLRSTLVSDNACQNFRQLRVQLHDMDVAGLAGHAELGS